MTDNLNEIAARWLGLKWHDKPICFHCEKTEEEGYHAHYGNDYDAGKHDFEPVNNFDPLHDMNDLVRVEEKLPKWYEILITKGEFYIRCTRVAGGVHSFGYVASGNYPADYPTALLELVKTLYERGKGNATT